MRTSQFQPRKILNHSTVGFVAAAAARPWAGRGRGRRHIFERMARGRVLFMGAGWTAGSAQKPPNRGKAPLLRRLPCRTTGPRCGGAACSRRSSRTTGRRTGRSPKCGPRTCRSGSTRRGLTAPPFRVRGGAGGRSAPAGREQGASNGEQDKHGDVRCARRSAE